MPYAQELSDVPREWVGVSAELGTARQTPECGLEQLEECRPGAADIILLPAIPAGAYHMHAVAVCCIGNSISRNTYLISRLEWHNAQATLHSSSSLDSQSSLYCQNRP